MPYTFKSFKWKIFLCLAGFIAGMQAGAETGYELWLRYKPVEDAGLRASYLKHFHTIYISPCGQTGEAILNECQVGLKSVLGAGIQKLNRAEAGVNFLLLADEAALKQYAKNVTGIKEDGFLIDFTGGKGYVLASTPAGLLYGAFHLLRCLTTGKSLAGYKALENPAIKWRMLNHWDNLNRSVERGYAGLSLWNWHTLPGYIDKRYTDYARANASIGINATVLTNVNANATVLTPMYLEKVKALADVFRPYGIRVFLTARFSAPIELGKLKTADPLDPEVQKWWQAKTAEIYKLIPDFGGFLVKANSEGQPGPQNYGRSHADGANMLAKAVKPFKGIIIWRAFVYSSETPEDRFKQSYSEFVPLDGKFDEQVVIQVKNGPVDFQPREPFHPLFGAMPKTPAAVEFQLTQEYTGFATHLVYQAPMYTEVLRAETYRPRAGTTVARIADGTAFGHSQTVMAGVSNIGNEINWTGHPFAQANWYALGRLAWNPDYSAEAIAEEWIKQTFSTKPAVVSPILKIMMTSYEAMVNYMTPLGLHHIMGYGHHYGPAPWYNSAPRADWNCTYFHRADEKGIGFDRTPAGSNALGQYAEPLQKKWGSLATTDNKWLTWFHHVPWGHIMPDGKSFWQNLCMAYQNGVNEVQAMQAGWEGLKGQVDYERYQQVKMLLQIQYNEAVWWKDACLVYFKTFSKMDYPAGVQPPKHTLDYYQSLQFPYAPGNTH